VTEHRFDGWRVVFAATVGLACGIATLGASTFSIFVGPIRLETGWSQSAAFAALIAVTFTAALMSPLMGAIVDRFGAKRVILVGFVCEIAIFASFALQGPDIWSFYLRYFLLSAFALGTTHVAFARVITLWFDRRRGLALGIALSGVGIGGFIWPLFVQAMIEAYGWRTAYLLLAGAIGAIALPTISWLLRDDPASLGQRPDGDADESRGGTTAQPVTGITLGVAVRSRTFWLILSTFFVIGFAIQSALMHLVPLLTSRGISPMAAAIAQSMMFLAVTTGRLVTGWLMDRFFAPHVALAFLLAPIAGLAMLAMEIPDGLAVVAALMIGLAVGAEVDVLAYLNSRYFGMLHFSRIYGSFYGIYSLSGGVGPLATAMIVERGGYSAAMFTLCGLLVAGCFALLSFPPFPPVSTTPKP
jgi:MFS family permease